MRLFIALCVFLLPSVTFCAPAPAPVSLSLHQVKLSDLARVVFGDLLGRSYIFDGEVINSDDDLSVHWSRLAPATVEELTVNLFRVRGYEFDQVGKVLLLRKQKKEDAGLLIYKPRYRSARYLSDILEKVADAYQLGTRGLTPTKGFRDAAALSRMPEVKGSAMAAVDRSAVDQLAYACDKDKCARLEKLLVDLDSPEAQVVLRAAVYEVGTTTGQGSAIQIAANLLNGKIALNLGGSLAGAAQLHLAAGGLDAVLSVLDQDGRFKVVSRPMLRVRTGAQARFSVGQQVPVLGSISLDKSGNAIQSVEYRQSGTIFTVQPDVRREVVDLDITQELSSFAVTTTGVNNSPTLLQRTASSQLSIRPGEVVVFAGLEEQRDDQAESRFFGWSLGEKKNSSSTEVLLFIEAQSI